MIKTFSIDDLVLPNLQLPKPCPVTIEITANSVFLCVGQRDWQWNRKDGTLEGAGTSIISEV